MPSVLIVEDDETIRKMYTTGLTIAGFSVTTAASGAEALVRVEEAQYDVILLDMLMTGMSGLDFLRSYDIRTKAPNTKVIALTNLENPTIQQKVMDTGVTEYLTKSNWEPVKLAEHINALLGTPSAPSAPPAPPAPPAQ
jgi:two-component system phosphate regulon response regulator PhoB